MCAITNEPNIEQLQVLHPNEVNVLVHLLIGSMIDLIIMAFAILVYITF